MNGSGNYCGIMRYFNLLEKEGMIKEDFIQKVRSYFINLFTYSIH